MPQYEDRYCGIREVILGEMVPTQKGNCGKHESERLSKPSVTSSCDKRTLPHILPCRRFTLPSHKIL